MAVELNVKALADLIPFVSQLKEIFFNWITLDDNNCNRLKFMIEENKNSDIKPIMSALEHWDELQKYGAPGVEIESVVCDNNTLRQIIETSAILNELILDMADIKSTDNPEEI